MKRFMKWPQTDKIVTIIINNCEQVGSAITNQMTPDSQKHLIFNFATNPENTICAKGQLIFLFSFEPEKKPISFFDFCPNDLK